VESARKKKNKDTLLLEIIHDLPIGFPIKNIKKKIAFIIARKEMM